VREPSEPVESYQEELSLIKTILKNNPKGMTVTDISREMNTNRNSVAKYLDILLISGHAEMITFGPAKVYFPSRRIPLSAILDFISDYVMVLDGDLKIVQVNDMFLEFLDAEREVLLGQRIENAALPMFATAELLANIQETLDGKEFTDEIDFQGDGDHFYFRIRLIPTAFEDGGQGVTIIVTNITATKRIERALQGDKKKLGFDKARSPMISSENKVKKGKQNV
jgi:PAS domain S-box-containing protein